MKDKDVGPKGLLIAGSAVFLFIYALLYNTEEFSADTQQAQTQPSPPQPALQFEVASSTPDGCGFEERIVFLQTYEESQVRSFLKQRVNSNRSLCSYRIDVYQPGKKPGMDMSYGVGVWKGKKKLLQIRING